MSSSLHWFNLRFPNFSSPTSHSNAQFDFSGWCAVGGWAWRSRTCIRRVVGLCSRVRCSDDRRCKFRKTLDRQCVPAWSIRTQTSWWWRWEFPSRCTQRVCSPMVHSTTEKRLKNSHVIKLRNNFSNFSSPKWHPRTNSSYSRPKSGFVELRNSGWKTILTRSWTVLNKWQRRTLKKKIW